jgi:hypothetical protein
MTTRRTRIFNNLALSIVLFSVGGAMWYYDFLPALGIVLLMLGTLPHSRIAELLFMPPSDYEMADKFARRKTDTPGGRW